MLRVVRLIAVASVIFLSFGCKEKSASTASPAEVADVCSALSASYFIPGDPPSHGQIKRSLWLRRLVSADELERMEAARKLLKHSECHTSAIVEAAIRTGGESGDPRVFADLAEIVTQRGFLGDPCRGADDGNNGHGNDPDHDDDSNPGHGGGNHGAAHKPSSDGSSSASGDDEGDDEADDAPVAGVISYPLSSRIAAAAALGRIVERDRALTPQELGEEPTDPVIQLSIEDKEASAMALELAGCPGEHADLRSAALEAVGITRLPSARPYLETVANDPMLPDDEVRALLLRGLSNRSLTNIMANQHNSEEAVGEVREIIRAYNEAIGGGAQ